MVNAEGPLHANASRHMPAVRNRRPPRVLHPVGPDFLERSRRALAARFWLGRRTARTRCSAAAGPIAGPGGILQMSDPMTNAPYSRCRFREAVFCRQTPRSAVRV